MSGTTTDLRNFSGRLILVGAGKMGGALLEGWLRSGLDPKSVDRARAATSGANFGAREQRGVQINPGIGTN